MVSTVLRENGYDVTLARDRYGPGAVDAHLIDDALAREAVIPTRDRDVAALATDREHRGILPVASPDADPGTIARGVNRLTEVHDEDELADRVVRVENWVRRDGSVQIRSHH